MPMKNHANEKTLLSHHRLKHCLQMVVYNWTSVIYRNLKLEGGMYKCLRGCKHGGQANLH